MKKLLLSSFIISALSADAQIFWTENFGTGCNQGTVASSYTGTNGTWAVNSTGTNDAEANQWFVSATEAGMGTNQCGDGCLNNSGLTNATLHLGNVFISITGTPADNGASYLSGGFCSSFNICATTNRRAESPAINCTGKAGIALSFNYMENGDGATDDASLWYFNGSTWALLFNLAKTAPICPGGQGLWTAYTVNLPSSANNNPNVKIGFNWTNNDDGVGTDPSFAVDDITLNSTSTYVPPVVPFSPDVQVYASGKNIVIETQSNFKVISVNDVLGRSVKTNITGNTIALTESKPGIYFVQLEVKGILITKKVLIQ